MKDEKASSACDYTTSDFEDMLSIDPGLQPDTFLGDLDIANLIDNDWIFENMSSAGHPGLPFDSLIHQDDASADGLMKNETTSVPFCNETHQRMLAGSSGSSSPESGHFTENSFSDEHSIATDLSPGRSCKFGFDASSKTPTNHQNRFVFVLSFFATYIQKSRNYLLLS